jgi:ABC-2 type transport system ATP-binding protein
MSKDRHPLVETSALAKRFGDTPALDGLDLIVPTGSVYAVLGPNGAGKTTLIRILATLVRPDAGTARVLGHDVVREAAAVRRRIGLTGQFAALDEHLTGRENAYLLARLRGLSRAAARARAAELLGAFGLEEAAARPVKTYSGGMRRRLDVAASLICTPDLLFLDEPTTGLDPHSRRRVWELVRDLRTTVLLTTQYLEEADQLAHRIAMIDRGRVVAEGTPSELKASVGSGRIELRLADPARREEAARLLAHAVGAMVATDPDEAVLSAPIRRLDRLPQLLTDLQRAGIALGALSVGQPRLDDVFLELTEAA